MRLFIAVEIPAGLRRRLAEVVEQLTSSGAAVKWVAEQNFHVTMKFLGNVDEEQKDDIQRALQMWMEGVSPFNVELSTVGAFPNPSRPRVIWVGITQGSEELKSLAERIEAAMERTGFAPEDRPFAPHITIGRVREHGTTVGLREALELVRTECVGEFTAESVALMRSDLRPTGPIYTRIADFALKTAD